MRRFATTASALLLAITVMCCGFPLGISGPTGPDGNSPSGFFRLFQINANALTEGVFTYEEAGGEAVLTGCNSILSGDVTLPGSLGGMPVTGIGASAFAGLSGLTGVELPGGLRNIGAGAFKNCGSLRFVMIPASVETIDNDAFLDSPQAAIYGATGSYAEVYAEQNGIPFIDRAGVPVTGIRLDPTTASVSPGESLTIKAAVVPQYAGNRTVAWASSLGAVAEVSREGVVTARYPGIAVIEARTEDGGYQARCVVSVLPAVPGAAAALSKSYNSIFISWNRVTGATGYVVYRYNAAGASYTRIQVTAGLGHTDTGLITGTQYTYKVRAYTSTPSGNLYGVVSGPLAASPVPAVPPSVQAQSASYRSVKVIWGRVEGASGYVVYRSGKPDSGFERLAVVKTAAYIDNGLISGQTYYYKVRAYTAMPEKNVYGLASGAAGAKALPAVPGLPKATSHSYTSILLTWEAVEGATGYVLYRYDKTTDAYERIKVTAALRAVDTDRATGTVYSYKVRAYTHTGSANVFGDLSAGFTGRAVPAAPASFSVDRSGGAGNQLTWSAVAGASGYLVYRYNSLTKVYDCVNNTVLTNFTDKPAALYQCWYYKVRAYRRVGSTVVQGDFSARKAPPSVIVYRGNTQKPEIAFTFDDAGAGLGRILGICNQKGVKATFFLLAGELRANPQRWRDAVKQGHQICNHTRSHNFSLGKLSEAQIRQDVLAWEDACRDVLGEAYLKKMKAEFPFFRSPGGNSTARLQRVLGDLGYPVTAYWSCEDVWFQSHNPNGWTLSQNYINHACNGAIFLMHGGSSGALAAVIDGVRARGYTPVTFSAMLD